MISKINIKSLSKERLFRFTDQYGLPRYRAEQLIHWIYDRYASEINEITEFSKNLRNHLNNVAYISNLKHVRKLKSRDGTEKYLFSLEDGEQIESVLIPDKGRLTLCISSQVGCAMGCLFCLTARCGMIRNLRSYEIVDQIIAVNKIIKSAACHAVRSAKENMLHPAQAENPLLYPPLQTVGKRGFWDKKVTNVVFMGMGEPLANFDEVVEAIARIHEFLGISKRKITLSTSGIVPKMLLLPRKSPEINLAVSLNATTDEVRNAIMPVTKRYPIKELIAACREYPLQQGRRITFEYVMISGLNDSPEDARRLIKLLRGIRCKVNLIPLNPFEDSHLKSPTDESILAFQKILLQGKLRALIRESRGKDILAACGQLRAGG